MPASPKPPKTSACSAAISSETGISSTPIPRKSRARAKYMRPAAETIWPHARRRPARSGADGRQVVRLVATTRSSEQRGEDEQRHGGAPQQLHERPRTPLDDGAEAVSRLRAEDARRRDGVGPVAPVLRRDDRLHPRSLQIGPGRAVEERLLQLAPAALVRDPRQSATRGSRVARDRHHPRLELDVRSARVVAADALLRGAAEDRARRRRSWRASRRPDRRPAGDRRRARASRRPSQPARTPRAGCSRPQPAPASSAAPASAASKTSWTVSQSPSCRLFQSL